ncbi:MAG: DNA methyltransferase [Acidimicrobiaceae bacterium]|nr:DNA methyltransferase [Acidimicrobiaceae bacterium]
MWSPPKTGTYAAYIDRHWIPGYKSIPGVHDRLDALDAAGLIAHPTTGFWPGLKRFAEADLGKPLQDIFYEPTGLTNYSGKERVGYPTQKPLALLDLLIRSSTNPGDVVLDPFCGCATTCVSADRLQRQWVGIDLSPVAAKLVLKRIRDDQGPLFDDVTHRTDLPKRDDLGELPSYRTHKHTLYGQQEGHCNGCRVLFPFRNFTVDHVVPKAKGGSDHIDNLQLLCGSCNSTKGTGTHAELIAKLQQQGVI